MPDDKKADQICWLLTGGSGRIGRMLLRSWQCDPPAARVLVQRRRALSESSPDITSSELIWDPLLEPLPVLNDRISCLIAFAGVTPSTGSELGENALLAEASLASAHAAGITRVLLTSSSAVYGAARGRPMREGDVLLPLNPYGASKVAMEAVCAPWRARGLEICILRIGNVVGADALLLNGTKAGFEAPLRLDRFTDGRGPYRSYIGPATLARVIESLAMHPAPLPELLNVAAPIPIGMDDLANAACIPRIWNPAPVDTVQTITLDVSPLACLHHFDSTDSDPVEMVRQWTKLRDKP